MSELLYRIYDIFMRSVFFLILLYAGTHLMIHCVSVVLAMRRQIRQGQRFENLARTREGLRDLSMVCLSGFLLIAGAETMVNLFMP